MRPGLATRLVPTVAGAVVGVLLCAGESCSVKTVDPSHASAQTRNKCREDSDCKTSTGHNATCASGMCWASSGDLDSVYLEILPPASAFWGAGDSFLVPLSEVNRGGWDYSINVPQRSRIVGKITLKPSLLGTPPSEACSAVYDPVSSTLAMHLEIVRSESTLGLPAFATSTKTTLTRQGAWEFTTTIPSGNYDIYLTALADCIADFPPLFSANHHLEPGDVKYDLTVNALASVSGQISIRPSPNNVQALAGWTVSLVSPSFGKVISTTRKLGDTVPTNFNLRYQAIAGQTPLLHLQPPQGHVAPEMYWDLGVLDLDADGQIQLDIESLDLRTVRVTGTVVDTTQTPMKNATIRVRSKALSGVSQGLTSYYETSVTSAEDGSFAMVLLPGTYQVLVTPASESPFGITQTYWSIAPSTEPPPAPQTLVVQPRNPVDSVVFDPSGRRPMQNLQISIASANTAVTALTERLVSEVPIVVRPVSGFTDDEGLFWLDSDRGLIDLTARASKESNLPWLAVPRRQVSAIPWPPLHLSYPIPLGGTITDPNRNPIQSALLRVFATVKHAEYTSTVQVAEGRTNKDGSFLLLLPSQVPQLDASR